MRRVLLFHSIEQRHKRCCLLIQAFVLAYVVLFAFFSWVTPLRANPALQNSAFDTWTNMTVESLLPLAEAGNVSAQFNLAVLYREGERVERNYCDALKWFTRAAEQGDVDAQNNLGLMYLHGLGTPTDYEEAHKWIGKAVEHGLAEAQELVHKLWRLYGKNKQTITLQIFHHH